MILSAHMTWSHYLLCSLLLEVNPVRSDFCRTYKSSDFCGTYIDPYNALTSWLLCMIMIVGIELIFVSTSSYIISNIYPEHLIASIIVLVETD